MGYETRFKLEIFDLKAGTTAGTPISKNRFNKETQFEFISKDEEFKYNPEYLKMVKQRQAALSTLDKGDLEIVELAMDDYPMKWYDYNDTMKAISLALPEYGFILTGFGEDSGDIWRKFYVDGNVTGGKAEIIFPKAPVGFPQGY